MSATPTENQVKIAFLTSNLMFARELLATLKKQEEIEEHKERFKIFPASDKIRFLEICSNQKFDLYIVDEELVGGDLGGLLGPVDNVLKLKEFGARPPVILVCPNEKTPRDLRQILSHGINEVVIRPFDMPLLLQAIDRCLPNKRILEEPQLFKMSASDEVAIASPMEFETISETEISVLGNRQFSRGEIVSLFSKPFDDENGSLKEVIAVCSSSQLAPTGRKYRTTFVLQGITPALSRNIRKWIQSTSAKQNSI